MQRFSVWGELGRRRAFQLERDDETQGLPQLPKNEGDEEILQI